MASKESGRTTGLMAKLQALREAPPAVVVCNAPMVVQQNGLLLQRLRNFPANTHTLSTLVDVCHTLQRTTLAVESIRFNRYGKVEVFLPQLASQLKSLKASAEEIEKLAWVQFPAYGDEQVDVCREAASMSILQGSAKAKWPFHIHLNLVELSCVQDKGNADIGVPSFGLSAARKEIVYGRWQIIKEYPAVEAPPPLMTSCPMSGGLAIHSAATVPPSKEKRKEGGEASAPSAEKEPPKKRSRKGAAPSTAEQTTVVGVPELPNPDDLQLDDIVQ